MANNLKKLILLSLLIGSTMSAQLATRATHDKSAAVLKELYNRRQFDSIYNLLSPGFQATVTRSDFIAFLTHTIYEPLGEILQSDFLQDQDPFYIYILNFKPGRLRMDLALNSTGQIDGLQFLPYNDAAPKTKVVNYASDNLKQSTLDLLMDSVARPFMQNPQNCGLSIGIIKNGETHFYNYGEITRGSAQLPDQNTLYEIGSLTKTFCGLLLAQAVVEKKIGLNEEVRRYLPGKYVNLALNGKPMLIKHLANHSSGLPSVPENIFDQPDFDSLNPYKNYSRQQLFNYLKTVKLNTEPGTVCQYSNLGMSLLGIILEGIYNKPFEAMVREKICVPAQMNSVPVQLNNEQLTRFADGYNQNGDATPHWNLNTFSAAGGLHASTNDMLRYLSYQLAETDAGVLLSHQPTFTGRETVALAWFIKKTKQGHTLLWHNGATYGFSSFTGFIKEKDCGVIILSNSLGSVDHIGIALLNYLQQ